MISTRWLQGKNNIKDVLEIRNKVFIDELKFNLDSMFDIYDDFAFNAVVYEDDIPTGTGRLLFKEGKYFIDNVGVLKEYRGKKYGDLIVRLLVRRAVNMGAEKTYAEVGESCIKIFENIGFEKINTYNDMHLMVKCGDVSGHCSKI